MRCLSKNTEREPLILNSEAYENNPGAKEALIQWHLVPISLVLGGIILLIGLCTIILAGKKGQSWNGFQTAGLVASLLGFLLMIIGGVVAFYTDRQGQALGGHFRKINAFFYNCCHDTPLLPSESPAYQV